MTYRKILVPFSGTDRYAGIISTALVVAKKFQANCEVLYIRPEPSQALPYLGESAPGVVVGDIVDAANKAAEEAAKRLKIAIEQAAKDANVPLVGKDDKPSPGVACVTYVQGHGDALDIIARESRLADLVVFVGGEKEKGGLPTGLTSVLMNTTRPILLVPGADFVGQIGSNAAIAWDGSAEAANAVRGALPFLEMASSVKIMNVQENLAQEGLKSEVAAELGAYLDLRCIDHAEAYIDPRGKTISETILDQAQLDGCDLLVMGGYGHSRMREMLLGGVTQYMLGHAVMPVLLAH